MRMFPEIGCPTQLRNAVIAAVIRASGNHQRTKMIPGFRARLKLGIRQKPTSDGLANHHKLRAVLIMPFVADPAFARILY